MVLLLEIVFANRFTTKHGVSLGRKKIRQGSAEAGAQKAPHARQNSPPQEVVFTGRVSAAARFARLAKDSLFCARGARPSLHAELAASLATRAGPSCGASSAAKYHCCT